jgi:class 3 adenylate cyclase
MTTTVTGPALVSGELVIPIWRTVSLIGRVDPVTNGTPDVDLTGLDDRRTVSRRHARVLCKANRFLLRDLGSTNGTWVNGERLAPQVDRELEDGDLVRFGRVELFYTNTAGWPEDVVAEWDTGTLQMTINETARAAAGGASPLVEHERVLATVMFTDIAKSTDRLASVGDNAYRELLFAHRDIIRTQLARFQGRELQTTGDGFLALFESPARSVRCACAIVDEVGNLGIQVRVGLHSGELDINGDEVNGIAVHIAARVSGKASGGEVMVSATVRDLVVGSDLAFVDRGLRGLKGLPGRWRLYSVDMSSGAAARPTFGQGGDS